MTVIVAPKTRYRPAQVAAMLLETKGMVSVAAKRLGCAPQIVQRYCQRFEVCQDALYTAREEMTDVAELQLFAAIMRGESWAITFYLKTIGRDRGYGDRVDLEISVRQLAVEMGIDPESALVEAQTILEQGRRKKHAPTR